MSNYEVVIGIETHVQLATKSKLFCGCNNDSREAEPNTNVCPVCLGFPGALPVLNGAAVKMALKAGHALNAYEDVKEFHSKFDRKNYFYPDSPMNYQITQFDEPIIGPGYVEFPINGKLKRAGVARAHLEADAGKLVHPPGKDYSLVDLNRAGTPLLEIVSEPDMRSAEEAKAYALELYHLMRFAEVSDANLYYGNMRFDVNVSLRPAGSRDFGVRTESKNLNSFRAVQGVIEYETERQTAVLERGEKVVQETRGWDENKQVTFSQRSKEEAHDYRYFPEPDLPPLQITSPMLEEAAKAMPNDMPNSVRSMLHQAGISAQDTEVVIETEPIRKVLLEVIKMKPSDTTRIAGWLTNEYPRISIDQPTRLNTETVPGLLALVQMVADNKLSSTNAKVIFEVLVTEGGNPETIAHERDLIQVSDTGALEKIVEAVIADHPKPVADYRAGEVKALGFLVGQVMKLSKGQANPPMVNDILKKKLGDQ